MFTDAVQSLSLRDPYNVAGFAVSPIETSDANTAESRRNALKASVSSLQGFTASKTLGFYMDTTSVKNVLDNSVYNLGANSLDKVSVKFSADALEILTTEVDIRGVHAATLLLAGGIRRSVAEERVYASEMVRTEMSGLYKGSKILSEAEAVDSYGKKLIHCSQISASISTKVLQ